MGEAKLPWMKFNATEFMGDGQVGQMTATERGIYISLMCHCWTEGGVPDNKRRMALIANASVEDMELAWDEVLAECFEPHPDKEGLLVQPRVHREKQEALDLHRKRVEAGRKGGKASGESRSDDEAEPKPGSSGASSGASAGPEQSSSNRASGSLDSTDVGSSPSEGKESEKGGDVAAWMHDEWHEVLGRGRRISLTPKRRQKYEAMHEEHLSESDEPRQAWRAVLWAVTESDYHMSDRSYQMPESILRNAERRDTWIERTVEAIQSGGGSEADRVAAKRRQRVAEEIRRRRREVA